MFLRSIQYSADPTFPFLDCVLVNPTDYEALGSQLCTVSGQVFLMRPSLAIVAGTFAANALQRIAAQLSLDRDYELIPYKHALPPATALAEIRALIQEGILENEGGSDMEFLITDCEQMVASFHKNPLTTILLTGPRKSGRTALAAHTALSVCASDFSDVTPTNVRGGARRIYCADIRSGTPCCEGSHHSG